MSSPVTAVERSENEKLGNCSATYASQATCPGDCPARGKWCYAETGFAGFTTSRLNRSDVTDTRELADFESDAIDSLSGRRPLRLHVVGDARTRYAARKLSAAARRYRVKHGKAVWTYTHAWRTVTRDCWDSVSVLASVESTSAAKEAHAAGYAVAIVVDRFESDKAYSVDGVKILPCPAMTKGVKCSDCALCHNADRLHAAGIAIGFESHGARKNAARIALNLV